MTTYRAEDQLKSYPVAIAPELVDRLEMCLSELNISPMKFNPVKEEVIEGATPSNPQTLLVSKIYPIIIIIDRNSIKFGK